MPFSRPPDSAPFLVHDAVTGEGRVSFTPDYLRLLQAGRVPSAEPGFVAAWLTGDPLAVRAWVEREAALLADGSEVADGPAAGADARWSRRR